MFVGSRRQKHEGSRGEGTYGKREGDTFRTDDAKIEDEQGEKGTEEEKGEQDDDHDVMYMSTMSSADNDDHDD